MELILLIIQIGLALGIIITVLMQQSSTDGFGLGGSSSSGTGLLSGRAKASALTRATAILATAFMINSMFFSYIVMNDSSRSLIDQIPAATVEKKAVEEELDETTPVVPLEMEESSVMEVPVEEKTEDVIKKIEQKANEVPLPE